jgi:hypothetical protein
MQEKGKRWKGLYRAGGLALIVVGILYLLGAVFSIIIGPPPSGTEEYMTALAGHRLISLTNFWLFALTDFLLIPAVLALYSALKGINRPAMLTAAGLMGLFVVL